MRVRVQDEAATKADFEVLSKRVSEDVAKKSDLSEINARLQSDIPSMDELQVLRETVKEAARMGSECKACADQVKNDLQGLSNFVRNDVASKAELQALEYNGLQKMSTPSSPDKDMSKAPL